jgi:Skp family chaperone for outer membrane proteins
MSRFALLGVLLSVFCWTSSSFAEALKIAVVDEQIVIDEYTKSKQLVKQLEDAFRSKEKELKQLESDIDQANRQMRTASVSKRGELMETISKGKIELEVSKKYLSEYFASQRNQFTLEVIKDIEAAIAVVGKDGGYDLVLRKTVPGPRGLEPQKTVFYHSERLDITKQVLSYLNAKFSQEKP